MPSAIDTTQTSSEEQEILPTPFDTQAPPYGHDGADHVERPPVSPITPSATFADVNQAALISSDPAYPHAPPSTDDRFAQRPSSLPINEDQNSDVIALQSTMSSLELQKQKARQDLIKLKQIRDAAVENPERFKDDMHSGRLAYESKPQDALKAAFEAGDDSEDDDDSAPPAMPGSSSKVPDRIPVAQDVVRAPPINWEKYHIVGEPLDRMHEEQQKRPTPGQPWSEAREAVVAAPYDPLKDKSQLRKQPQASQLPPPMETRRSNARRKSGG